MSFSHPFSLVPLAKEPLISLKGIMCTAYTICVIGKASLYFNKAKPKNCRPTQVAIYYTSLHCEIIRPEILLTKKESIMILSCTELAIEAVHEHMIIDVAPLWKNCLGRLRMK